MTPLCWQCLITPFVSALSLCLQSSREDGNISLFMDRVSSGTLAASV